MFPAHSLLLTSGHEHTYGGSEGHGSIAMAVGKALDVKSNRFRPSRPVPTRWVKLDKLSHSE